MHAYLAAVLADCVTPSGADCNQDEALPLQGLLAFILMVVVLTVVSSVIAVMVRRHSDRGFTTQHQDRSEERLR
jgi:uncharacterized membrane protein YhaH (DUF805 family)